MKSWISLGIVVGLVRLMQVQGFEGGDGGGTLCAGCTILLGLLLNDSHPIPPPMTVSEYMGKACSGLEGFKSEICKRFSQPTTFQLPTGDLSPDAICHDIGLCTFSNCTLYDSSQTLHVGRLPASPITTSRSPLFPAHPHKEVMAQLIVRGMWPRKSGELGTGGEIVGAEESESKIGDSGGKHLPLFDDDGDGHSTVAGLRGYHWRGADCNDSNAGIHPAKRVVGGDTHADSDCNGIWGVDKDGMGFESKWCNGSGTGMVIIGDSVGAHFSVPEDRMLDSLDAYIALAEDELDVPQCSYATGFEPSNSTSAPGADALCPNSVYPLDSLYLRLRERNLCNHRDYANLAVNGARSTSTFDSGIIQSLSRSAQDRPAVVLFALNGDDMCVDEAGASHMTTPELFNEKVQASLSYLAPRLPKGSAVHVVGEITSDIMYTSMATLPHPALNPITYERLWTFLDCLQSNPCWGYLNPNATWRAFTARRAAALDQEWLKIIANNASAYPFPITYQPYPINETVVQEWVKQTGNNVDMLFEWIGGGHPSTTAHHLILESVWQFLLQHHKDLIGPTNPFNDDIKKQFGNQGGYAPQ